MLRNKSMRAPGCMPGRFACGLVLSALVCVVIASGTAQARTENSSKPNPDVLWHLVHDRCTPAARQGRYPPMPCVELSAPSGHLDRGYAVLKDIRGRYQYLVLPVARVTGIESLALLEPGAPGYLGDAWAARLYVEAALHRIVPRYVLSLAVNSEYGRTQNQLHIHVDCIRSDVHDKLRRLRPEITSRWAPLPVPLRGHAYMARWVDGVFLSVDPFRSLAAALPAGASMGQYGLAVVGAYSPAGEPGFILLATRANAATRNPASSEELQDHGCAIVRRTDP